MKFKTRLQITFVSMILVPFISTMFAFLVIGFFLTRQMQGINSVTDGVQVTASFNEVKDTADDIFANLLQEKKSRDFLFEDMDYLDSVNRESLKNSVSILVLKNGYAFYDGDPKASEKIFKKLPQNNVSEIPGDTAYYFNDEHRYVRQISFTFSDGAEGQLYVIARDNRLISKNFLLDMMIAIGLILFFTAVLLTVWIEKGILDPINSVNEAMKKIKEGNFDYSLETNEGGEIGDLYRNYEDMRLRLKESAEEKIQNEKVNREMISNISHDLKTPITAIEGYVEGIMDGVADTPEKVDKYVKTIYNKANDMDRLINELTLYSGIDNNRIPYNFHRINVADYFGDCIEEVGLDLESKNIQLNYTNLADSETMVIADPEQMKKVINNIISNSVKYMDKQKGVIDIRILDQGESIQIEIEDNGKGIEQKNLGRIFERFYRTDASRNSAQGGSGIGLSIVKKIIEDHGGYIWATSKIGEGTCMHFVLRKYKELQS